MLVKGLEHRERGVAGQAGVPQPGEKDAGGALITI